MKPAHHLELSQRYLDFATANIAHHEYLRAAQALCRAASHAVTAASVHWGQRHYSRRRLTNALGMLVYDGNLAFTHRRTFREVYQFLHELEKCQSASGGETPGIRGLSQDEPGGNFNPSVIRLSLRRLVRRVKRLREAVIAAIAAQPSPETIQQVMARLATESLAARPNATSPAATCSPGTAIIAGTNRNQEDSFDSQY